MSSPPVLASIEPLTPAYDAWLTDVWGVMHNGVAPFPTAVDSCTRFRLQGGLVLLLSNAPRPAASVAAQLDRIGVPRFAYDAIVTSGDTARAFIAQKAGVPLFHLGPERDLAIYDGLAVTRVEHDSDAGAIVCTGLFDDEIETPADYAELLTRSLARGLPMICANPDIQVERGGKMVYCAGAIAAAYASLGGFVQYAGKPYLPIYDMAFAAVAQIKGRAIDKSRILAIGDGPATDIAGAAAAGVPSLYIASSVAMRPGETLEAGVLARLFPDASGRPIAAMSALAW
jgi:HAD superfamily hydrolase (TIGR01459 family)